VWRKRARKCWDIYGGFIIGAALIAAGLLLARLIDLGEIVATPLRRGLSEALEIAGILAFAVDPLVKSKAHRDATRDIFHHILGFNLPPKIKDRLLEIVKNTTLYRENMTLHYDLSEQGEFLHFDVAMEYEVVNPTQGVEPFTPKLQFEKGEKPVLKNVVCFNDPKYGNNARLVPDPKQPNSLAYIGDDINIGSEDRRRFKYEYSIQYPMMMGFCHQMFQKPTIGLSLTVKSGKSIVVTTNPAKYESPGEWRYETLFMPGDHLDIQWAKVPCVNPTSPSFDQE
jgi:hypothetical protein